MKFVSIQSVKGLRVGDEVYTLDAAGKYGIGVLRERKETEAGTEITFETPTYGNDESVYATNITHVAKLPSREEKEKGSDAS